MKEIQLKLVFISIFIFSSSVIGYSLYFQKENRVDGFKERTLKQVKMEYNTIYNKQYEIANILFDSEINTPEIIALYKDAYISDDKNKNMIRQRMYTILIKKYEKLKKYDLKQLHFHLPDNDSFLRMHRPGKFGDNLTQIRSTVKYVNENKKFIHGFEEGRIFNGYRFVFPLFDFNKTHIGSVEISFSTLAFSNSLKKVFGLESNFLILKSIVDRKVFDLEKSNYRQSFFENFYFEKNILKNTSTKKQFKDKKVLAYLEKRLLNGEEFFYFDKRFNDILVFLPVINPIDKVNAAYFVVRKHTSYIPYMTRNYYIMTIVSLLFVATLLFALYKGILNKKYLERTIKEEVEKSRTIEKQLFLQSKQAQMGEMMVNIAHQWRQPLSVISTSAGGTKLESEYDTLSKEKLEKSMDYIIESAQFLSKTIDLFTKFIKQESKTEDVILQNRIDETIEIIDETLKSKKVRIIKNIDYGTPLHTKITVGELSQVLINIINNAVEAMEGKDDKWIKISLYASEKDKAVVTVEDNGGGIPEECMDKLFDPYFTTKHKSQGTGLSLYMSHEIVTGHLKGKLYVQNTKNGAKFFIEIPLIDK